MKTLWIPAESSGKFLPKCVKFFQTPRRILKGFGWLMHMPNESNESDGSNGSNKLAIVNRVKSGTTWQVPHYEIHRCFRPNASCEILKLRNGRRKRNGTTEKVRSNSAKNEVNTLGSEKHFQQDSVIDPSVPESTKFVQRRFTANEDLKCLNFKLWIKPFYWIHKTKQLLL